MRMLQCPHVSNISGSLSHEIVLEWHFPFWMMSRYIGWVKELASFTPETWLWELYDGNSSKPILMPRARLRLQIFRKIPCISCHEIHSNTSNIEVELLVEKSKSLNQYSNHPNKLTYKYKKKIFFKKHYLLVFTLYFSLKTKLFINYLAPLKQSKRTTILKNWTYQNLLPRYFNFYLFSLKDLNKRTKQEF